MRIEQKFIDEDFLYEMSNLSRRKFKKLPTNIFMSARNGSKHGPRIKIQNNYAENMQSENTFTMTIPDCRILVDGKEVERDSKQIKLKTKDILYFEKFVRNNKGILTEYWFHGNNMDITDVIDALIF